MPRPPRAPATEAHARARSQLCALTLTTRRPPGRHYVGNIPPVARLGVPPLNMMDAAGGFRTYWTELVGTVTCWPSLLSLGASWDPELVRQFAVALGAEFVGKGANAILGAESVPLQPYA